MQFHQRPTKEIKCLTVAKEDTLTFVSLFVWQRHLIALTLMCDGCCDLKLQARDRRVTKRKHTSLLLSTVVLSWAARGIKSGFAQ